MELKLNIDGQDKTFTVPFVSGRAFRRTLVIAKSTNFDDVTAETLDTLADYVVELFKGQFTRDELYDGIEADRLLPYIMECINKVVGKATEATEALQDPNDQTPASPATATS